MYRSNFQVCNIFLEKLLILVRPADFVKLKEEKRYQSLRVKNYTKTIQPLKFNRGVISNQLVD